MSSGQTQTQTLLVQSFSDEFARLYQLWHSLIEGCDAAIIYKQPEALSLPSIGECVLRSARVVEQAFGGLTANLWDDPLEWSLPEMLTTRESILEYIREVDATRKQAFKGFSGDSDLARNIGTANGQTQQMSTLLLRTLARAFELYGQAIMAAKMFSV